MKKILVITSLLTLLLPSFPYQVHASSWWDSSWLYRKQLTINNSTVSETLINFPVLVKLDSTRINYSQTKANGADIRFVDSTNTISYNYEIESWNAAGTSWIWVKIPTITASTTTNFYIYWGNPAAVDGQNVNGTWNANYTAVYHLKDLTTSTILDSTGGDNGTKKAANTPVEVDANSRC